MLMLRRSTVLITFLMVMLLGGTAPRTLATGSEVASPPDVPPSLAPVYEQLRTLASMEGYLALQEVATDQTMVPTRGAEWDDGGRWRALTQHEWTASHEDVAIAWDRSFQGVHRANAAIAGLQVAANRGEPGASRLLAEARFLRAFFYWTLLDLFGQVPLVTTVEESRGVVDPKNASTLPAQSTRSEVFDFVRSELEAVASTLPSATQIEYGRASQEAASALLARLYINSGVYTGSSNWDKAADAAQKVIDSGSFALMANYYDNFAADNEQVSESILSIPYQARKRFGNEPAPGNNFHFLNAHYNQLNPTTPRNGFTTIPAYYKSFEVQPGPDGQLGTRDDVRDDVRVNQFMAGQQYAAPTDGCYGINCHGDTTTSVLEVRGSSTPLSFTLEIPSLVLSGSSADLERPGLRPLKFEVDPNRASSGRFGGNDFPLIRYAEIVLIAAEAEAQRGNLSGAIDLVNRLRRRAEAPLISGTPSQSELLTLIFQERGRELHFEGHRRTDLIRYEVGGGSSSGEPYTSESDPYVPTFSAPWLFKEPSDRYQQLFPIPQSEFNANPNLVQNPGY